MTDRLSTRWVIPLLLLVLLAAASLRFYNLTWDNGVFAHPDERSTVLYYAPTIKWPENNDDLLDPRKSPLNPFWDVHNDSFRSFTYGHFPLYVLAFTGNLLHELAPLTEGTVPQSWTDFMYRSISGHGFAEIGRGLMALADLCTVILLFLMGKRLYGPWGGLLAAALSTFTVLQIQLAHFFAVDPVSTTFVALALYGAMLMYDHRSVGAALLCGIGIGLAVASKFSALPIAFAPVAAGLLASFYHPHKKRDDYQPASLDHMIGLALVSLVTSFLIFAITSPFILLDYDNFHRAVIDEQGRMASGVADYPYTRQYRGTIAYVYFIEQQLKWGMGWPLGLLAIAGTLWVMFKTIRLKAHAGELMILTWVVIYFGVTGLFLAKFMRYMIPVVPFVTLFGTGFVVAIWRYGSSGNTLEANPQDTEQALDVTDTENPKAVSIQKDEHPIDRHPDENQSLQTTPLPLTSPPVEAPTFLQKISRPVAMTLAAIVLLGSMIWSVAFVNGVYGTEHSWAIFARWVYDNVPDESCIVWEHWDDRMPVDLPEPRANAGARGYRQPQLPMYEEDSYEKYNTIRSTLTDCDYMVLATNRLWRTIPKLPERYPMSVRYYEALFSGELGFEEVFTVETPPTLGPISIDTQPADESFTVYDHPKPILFKKVRQLTPEEWDNVLAIDSDGGLRWEKAVPGYIGEPTLMMRLRGYDRKPSHPASDEESGKSLLLTTPINQLPVVNDFRWNNLANDSTALAILIWWLALMAIGLLAWPLTYHLLHHLPDRGYGLSKALGLLLISYFIWINSSLGLLQNRLSTIIIALVILALIAGWLVWQSRKTYGDYLWQQRWLILISELVFGLVYLFFIYLRMRNPDLWQPWFGGEKMMEIGFLNAILKSAEMPPYDPFFANGIMNYYYYGMFIIGVVIKLTGIQPAIGFNLAIASLAALTAINAFCLARNLGEVMFGSKTGQLSLSGVMGGIFAVIFVVFMGNLEGAAQFMRNLSLVAQTDFESSIPGLTTTVLAASGLRQVVEGAELITYNFWDPSRVIPATINEFPYFSFLFADLHPHMIGIPFTILFLSLAFNWLRAAPTNLSLWGTLNKILNTQIEIHPDQDKSNATELEASDPQPILQTISPMILRWLALPFVLGALAVINTWDLPTYLGIMIATFLVARYRNLTGRLTRADIGMLTINGIVFAITLLGMTYLLYWPFFANYQALDVGLGLVHTQTPLEAHLKIWGFFLFIIITWLWVSLYYPQSKNSFLRIISLFLRRWDVFPRTVELHGKFVQNHTPIYQLGLWSILLVMIMMLGLYWLEYRVPAYLLPLVLLSVVMLFRREISAEMSYVGLLIFTGLLLLLGVEAFFLRDFLGGGDHYRMNTLFKFYIQVWVIFGIAAAVMLPQLWVWCWQWRIWNQLSWRLGITILLMGGLIYPALGTPTRLESRFPGDWPEFGTLDGLAYMTVGQFQSPDGGPIILSYDYEAINWLIENVTGTPIIAEAKIGYYREGGMRVAAYTGLPSILGGLHQGEQRYASQIGRRDPSVNEFWNNPDPSITWQRMQELEIEYVYVGQVERATHGSQVDAKFAQLYTQGLLTLVYENQYTKIYHRADP